MRSPRSRDRSRAVGARRRPRRRRRSRPCPTQNWVALSQAALPPVAAGRFLVHGSHDRARVGARRTAIEIEAGEAFGTGHNATTALCLEALDRADAPAPALCARARPRLRHRRAGHRRRPRASRTRACSPSTTIRWPRRSRAPTCASTASAGRVRVIDAAGFAHPLLRRRELRSGARQPAAGPTDRACAPMRRALRPGGVAILSGLLDHQAREVAPPTVPRASGCRRAAAAPAGPRLTPLRVSDRRCDRAHRQPRSGSRQRPVSERWRENSRARGCPGRTRRT